MEPQTIKKEPSSAKLSGIRQNASDFNLEKAKQFTTYLFECKDMKDQVKRSRSESTADKWAREMEGKKRESKKRVVMIDGGDGVGEMPVTLTSIHDVEKAEREEKMGNRDQVKRQRAWVHETECFKCKEALNSTENLADEKDDTGRRKKTTSVHGDEIMCALCPKAFHLACVGLETKPSSFPPWKCPWHSCSECHNTSTQGGGFMFRCLNCPTSYCGACRPAALNILGKSTVPGLKTNLAIYVLCSQCEGLNLKVE